MKQGGEAPKDSFEITLENRTMASAVAHHHHHPPPSDASKGSTEDYDGRSVAYHYPLGHPPMPVYPSSAPAPYYQPPPVDGYSVAQYMSQLYAAAPPPPMPPHPAYHAAPPQAAPPPPAMYYGSWPGASGGLPEAMVGHHHPPHHHHGHHGSRHHHQRQSQSSRYHEDGQAPYETILPPDGPHSKRGGSRSKGGGKGQQQQHGHPHGGRRHQQQHYPYGSLELNVFTDGTGTEDEELLNAIGFVKRNPKATLFDVHESMIPDIACYDEASSRFVQRRLRVGTVEEQRLCLSSSLASVDRLWKDHYGNFMLQGLFEFGSRDAKRELMDAIYEQGVVDMCMHMHGCRVIQKAIRCLDQEDVSKLILEFRDQVLAFIHDPNGNHVIQRCIQVMSAFAKAADNGAGERGEGPSPSEQMQFIIDDIVSNAEELSMHRYGCRVVQRAVEHCVEEQKNAVLEEIISCHGKLVEDQYGNYVVQQVMVCGSEAHQAAILKTLTDGDSLLALSKHKYASNVVESVLMHGGTHAREVILEEMLKDTRDEVGGYCCVIELAMDSIANYVVNKAIEVSEKEQQEKFAEVISSSRQVLSKSPYAKYVLQRIDKLELDK